MRLYRQLCNSICNSAICDAMCKRDFPQALIIAQIGLQNACFQVIGQAYVLSDIALHYGFCLLDKLSDLYTFETRRLS